MASTFFGLSISYKGLQAAQTSITTSAHNLSNINTEGYTKQSAELKAAVSCLIDADNINTGTYSSV